MCLGLSAIGIAVASPGKIPLSSTTECSTAPYVSPRLKLNNELIRTLRPLGSSKTFPVIYGADGSGKSTVVRKVIDDLESDAVFIEIPANAGEFDARLSSILGCSPGSVDECIMQSTDRYFEVNHRPMMIVFDSVENLARVSPMSVQKLLRAAKDCADNGRAKIVFVCNDSALYCLQRDSLWSSADPIEVPELSELEAIQYLTARKVQPSTAKEAVLTVTGGNLHLLNRLVESLVKEKKTLEEVRTDWYREVRQAMEQQEQLLSHCQLGLRLLTDKKSVSVREAGDYWTERDTRRLVVDHGVLSYHSGGKFLKLRSKLVERYFTEKFGKN